MTAEAVEPGSADPYATGVPARPRRGRLAVHALRLVVGLGLAALAAYVVAGHSGEITGATALLEHAHWAWLILAVPAEAASIVAYAALEGRLLRAGAAPIPLGALLNITLAGNAIQNSLPAGQAWAAGFAFGQFRKRGADAVLSTWTLVATGFVSAAALVVLSVGGVAVAAGQASTNDLVGGVAIVAAVAVGIIVAVRLGLHARWVPWVLTLSVRLSRKVVHRPEGDPAELVDQALKRLTAVRPGVRDWVAAGGWGVSNWLLDCTCLALAFPSVGAGVPWRGLLLAYGAGQLAANLPITPGGLGAVEGSLTVALVAYGGGRITTVAAVLMYRIISFWLLLVVGWLTYLVLRWRKA
jgi:putative heme transporter